MEVINHHTEKRTDTQLLVVTHLTQLLYYVTGFGGLIVPLIIWLTQKEKVEGMDQHGKAIVNFQISLILYTLISIPAILLLGLGILMIIAVCILGFVLPVVNAIRASNHEAPSYFMTIRFIK
ncbi:MAG: tRNA modification GTPase [Flavobacteriaceae bacterium]|nr:tRNA modification GTPase [Flavobacteriaceae bacterium]